MDTSPPLKLATTDIPPLVAMNIGGLRGCHWIHMQLFSLMKVISTRFRIISVGWLVVALLVWLGGWAWAAGGMFFMAMGASIVYAVFYWQLVRFDAFIFRQMDDYREVANGFEHAALMKE